MEVERPKGDLEILGGLQPAVPHRPDQNPALVPLAIRRPPEGCVESRGRERPDPGHLLRWRASDRGEELGVTQERRRRFEVGCAQPGGGPLGRIVVEARGRPSRQAS